MQFLFQSGLIVVKMRSFQMNSFFFCNLKYPRDELLFHILNVIPIDIRKNAFRYF